jgi:cytosine/uracil/thiamine/allantoin permease
LESIHGTSVAAFEVLLAMIRRVSALIGIVLLLVMLASLIWAVHSHRQNTHVVGDPEELVSRRL